MKRFMSDNIKSELGDATYAKVRSEVTSEVTYEVMYEVASEVINYGIYQQLTKLN